MTNAPQQFDSLFELMEAFPTEQHAIDQLRALRWGSDDQHAYCPYCGSTRVMHFSDKKTHKCSDCRKRFSIKVGTIFHDSKISLRKWFMAIWLITSHKKGIASTQLAKDIKVTQKTAWFMLHRLRHATETASFNTPLKGDVEVDETYVGGKSKNMHAKDRKERKQYDKAAVMGARERGGELRTKHIPSPTRDALQGMVRDNVEPGSKVHTDANLKYRGLGDAFQHDFVSHSDGEYVRDMVHTNGIESVWALFKRQLIGTHHWVSKKHLQAYLNEMTWRLNRREQGEGERVNSFLSKTEGRLTYKELTA
jgi:transposase-like protein